MNEIISKVSPSSEFEKYCANHSKRNARACGSCSAMAAPNRLRREREIERDGSPARDGRGDFRRARRRTVAWPRRHVTASLRSGGGVRVLCEKRPLLRYRPRFSPIRLLRSKGPNAAKCPLAIINLRLGSWQCARGLCFRHSRQLPGIQWRLQRRAPY